ncbi:hypothetical protein C7271_12235 [filamentous cyanobacterium CCP5]|nr:hypothetical protein C7271_12235 [filamentous cyanobacterium CCP5]
MLRRLTFSLPALVLGLALGWSSPSVAASPETAPEELIQALAAIEAAADEQAIETVMGYYHSDFASADGFTRATLETTLVGFWQEYASLDYDVELLSWEAIEGGYQVETLTTIRGQQRLPSRQLKLVAELRSQQRFQDGQIIYQETLGETSRVVSGVNPPRLTVLLPEQVPPAAEYEFDAIVQEPLGGRSLIGSAIEEGVTAEDFLVDRPLSLELLPAGGLFKLGRAPSDEDNRWISAIIVREDGLIIETRRLRVTD